jgi:hypothetical protein
MASANYENSVTCSRRVLFEGEVSRTMKAGASYDERAELAVRSDKVKECGPHDGGVSDDAVLVDAAKVKRPPAGDRIPEVRYRMDGTRPAPRARRQPQWRRGRAGREDRHVGAGESAHPLRRYADDLRPQRARTTSGGASLDGHSDPCLLEDVARPAELSTGEEWRQRRTPRGGDLIPLADVLEGSNNAIHNDADRERQGDPCARRAGGPTRVSLSNHS